MSLLLPSRNARADLLFRSCDVNVPSTNNGYVEYEVLLCTCQQRLAGGSQQHGAGLPSKFSAWSPSRARIAWSEPPTEAARSSSQAPQARQQRVSPTSVSPYTSQRSSKRTRSTSSEFATSTGSSSGQAALRPRLAWPTEPTTILSAATSDPFNSLPAPPDEHVNRLFHLYLNGDLLLNMRTSGAKGLRNSVLALRRENTFPMVMSSQAAYGALVAYIETTPDVPIRSSNELFLRWHLNLALSLTNAELKDPLKVDGDDIINTIVLLMIIAQRQDDHNTFIAHAQGLMALTQRRQRRNSGSNLVSTTPQQLTFSWRDKPSNEPLPYPSPITPTPLAFPPPNKSDQEAQFSRLVAKSLVSASFAHTQQYALVLNQLAGQGRFDWPLALAIAQHLWTDGGTPLMTSLELACHSAVRLCMHLNVWPVAAAPCIVGLRRVAAIRAALKDVHLDLLVWESPDVLVWLALVAGPLATGHARAWFAAVLSKAHALSGIMRFPDAVNLVRARFAWSPAMTLAAEAFWLAVVYPTASFSDDRGRHGGIAGDLVARAATSTTQRYSGPWMRQPSEQAIRDAEESFLATVAEHVVYGTDAAGRETCSVWVPPSPSCLLRKKCLAHSVKREADDGEGDWSGF